MATSPQLLPDRRCGGRAGRPKASLELFRRLVQDLHSRGIRVVLDVPLNHASKAYDRKAGDPGQLKPRATAGPAGGPRRSGRAGGRVPLLGLQPRADPPLPARTPPSTGSARRGSTACGSTTCAACPTTSGPSSQERSRQAKPAPGWWGRRGWTPPGQEANAADIATYYEQGALARGLNRPQFDSLFDFPLQMVMTSVFAKGNPATDLEEWLQRTGAIYGPDALPARFLDNHDMARFLAWTSEPDRLVAAVGFLASLSGPIVLFYGTETGLSHGGPKAGFTDAGRVPCPGKLDQPLLGRIQKILQAPPRASGPDPRRPSPPAGGPRGAGDGEGRAGGDGAGRGEPLRSAAEGGAGAVAWSSCPRARSRSRCWEMHRPSSPRADVWSGPCRRGGPGCCPSPGFPKPGGRSKIPPAWSFSYFGFDRRRR